MRPQEKQDRLIMRYFDGQTSEKEVEELNELLRASEDARRDMREIASQVVAIADLGRERDLHAPARKSKPDASQWWGTGAAWVRIAVAATVAVGIVTWLMPRETASSPVVWIEDVVGTLSWTSAGGESRTAMEVGERVPAGLFELSSEGGSAQLRFHDGTRLTLFSGCHIAIVDHGQKRLHLKSGSLTVDARPQPRDRPMILQTSTARVEVLGTVFSLDASDDVTDLGVSKGSVLMERLQDRASIEVGENQRVVTRLGQSEALELVSVSHLADEWRHRFDIASPRNWRGTWQPPSIDHVGSSLAVPCVAGHDLDGTPKVVYGLTVRGTGRGLVAMSPEGVVAITYRSREPTLVRVMLSLNKEDGRFAGNFETQIAEESDPTEWCTVYLPLSGFHPQRSGRHPAVTKGAGLTFIFITSYADNAGLEVSEIAVLPTLPSS